MTRPHGREFGLQPYVPLLNAAMEGQGVHVEPFRALDAMRHAPDVIHIHWPEHALAAGIAGVVQPIRLLLGVAIARRRGATLVTTAHNATPHDLEVGAFGRWFLRAFDRRVDVALLLTEASRQPVLDVRPGLRGAHLAHTRHGHFRDAYPPPPSVEDARERLGIDGSTPTITFAGQVRPYKGVLDLLDAAREIDVHIVIAGQCRDGQLRAAIEDRASSASVTLRLGPQSPADLVDAIAAATVVALPYRAVLNSGSALLALSLDRPVLVPAAPSFRELAADVGSAWVRCYDGATVSAADLRDALAAAPTGRPDLAAFEWDEVAAATAAAYRLGKADKARKPV